MKNHRKERAQAREKAKKAGGSDDTYGKGSAASL